MKSAGTVAIVGRPNVGKSALFNRLVGRNIAIVHDQPGITRDRIAAKSDRGDRPFTVWDTGGIVGLGEGELPSQVRSAADAAMREADVILFVVDAQAGLTPIDAEVARLLRRSAKAVVLVVNKIDHEKHEALAAEFARFGFRDAVSISAAHSRGVIELIQQIEKLLPQQNANAEPAAATAESPIAIAIVGKPNAGKSSLINAVLRDERTIVSDIPGTTRDAIDIPYEREGDAFVLIDTAGIRPRSKHSSSVEVFSVMRAERSIRRADLCVLVVDLTSGVTAQDKKIAGAVQRAQKACVVVLNKWDLVKPAHVGRATIERIMQETRGQLFFLPYAPLLVTSAIRGGKVEQLFRLIAQVGRGSKRRLGTGVLNRLLRNAMTETPPPMVGTRRLKLFYATQAMEPARPRAGGTDFRSVRERLGGEPSPNEQNTREFAPPKFVLFVNEPKLLTETYARYLEGRIRAVEPYVGLPMQLSCRARSDPS